MSEVVDYGLASELRAWGVVLFIVCMIALAALRWSNRKRE